MTKIKVIYVANLGREKGYRFIVDGELDPVVINEPLGRVKSALKSTYKPEQLIVLNHNEVMRIGDIREAITNHLNAPIKVIAPAAEKQVSTETSKLSVELITKEGETIESKPLWKEYQEYVKSFTTPHPKMETYDRWFQV